MQQTVLQQTSIATAITTIMVATRQSSTIQALVFTMVKAGIIGEPIGTTTRVVTIRAKMCGAATRFATLITETFILAQAE